MVKGEDRGDLTIRFNIESRVANRSRRTRQKARKVVGVRQIERNTSFICRPVGARSKPPRAPPARPVLIAATDGSAAMACNPHAAADACRR